MMAKERALNTWIYISPQVPTKIGLWRNIALVFRHKWRFRGSYGGICAVLWTLAFNSRVMTLFPSGNGH
jgi:hypothetical protein